jgi:hypothetical protein
MVGIDPLRIRIRHKSQPKNALNGSKKPAMSTPPPGREFMAAAPPVSGLFVSIVNCALAVAFAARLTAGLENWHVTPNGRDAQPSPIVSLNPPLETRLTVSVEFFEAAIVTDAGVADRLKSAGMPLIVTGCDVDALWSLSPP